MENTRTHWRNGKDTARNCRFLRPLANPLNAVLLCEGELHGFHVSILGECLKLEQFTVTTQHTKLRHGL